MYDIGKKSLIYKCKYNINITYIKCMAIWENALTYLKTQKIDKIKNVFRETPIILVIKVILAKYMKLRHIYQILKKILPVFIKLLILMFVFE